MKNTEQLIQVINNFEINQLINISELYEQQFAEVMSASAYAKNIERAVNKGLLSKVAKGVYCRPRNTRYGTVMPSEQEILREYIGENKGIIVGYYLYNEINISTQIAKTIEVFSNAINGCTRTINNIVISRRNLEFTKEVSATIKMFEVLKNFSEIQDLNYKEFISYCSNFAKTYNEEMTTLVIEQMKYSKSTIAFMRHILQTYNVNNNLSRYLSELSTYKYPSMERIYELAQFNW